MLSLVTLTYGTVFRRVRSRTWSGASGRRWGPTRASWRAWRRCTSSPSRGRSCSSSTSRRCSPTSRSSASAREITWWERSTQAAIIIQLVSDFDIEIQNDHDCDQICWLDCWQQSIPINFWLNRPQQHDLDIQYDGQNFQLNHGFGVG